MQLWRLKNELKLTINFEWYPIYTGRLMTDQSETSIPVQFSPFIEFIPYRNLILSRFKSVLNAY